MFFFIFKLNVFTFYKMTSPMFTFCLLLQRVGCDGVFGSTAVDDDCGVCRGDGSSCKTVSGDFHDSLPANGKIK